MLTKISVKLSPYPVSLLVLHGTRQEVNKYLSRISKFDFDSPGSSMHLYDQKDNFAICLDAKKCNHSTVAHEAVHITWFMNDHLCLNFSSKADEQQAYLVSYIMDEINKKLKIK